MKTALVLSGGGMFGAWQAGAWRALAPRFHPDLVVGASVGSLNGYAIAGGASPDDLADFWLRPEIGVLKQLPHTIRGMMDRYPPSPRYAVVLTDAFRLKPRIIAGESVTWRHLAASCAIPLVLPARRIDARWYCDGGLLNPLPVWAAIELGATRIVAVHALPQIPGSWLKPFVAGFRRVAGHNPPLAAGIEVQMIATPGPLGSLRDALRWKRDNIERWMEQGFAAAKKQGVG
ncbi:MAG TPA: patatin-like phospholipase family protein [Bryobacteraceae bacterium]|nr:patatin-like phospholipase family protein [Bryobacteraceae bacterium]